MISGGVLHGIPMLKANFPRAFLDVNREPYELDPKMFEGKLPDYVNTRSIRVTSGLEPLPGLSPKGNRFIPRKYLLKRGFPGLRMFTGHTMHRYVDCLQKPMSNLVIRF